MSISFTFFILTDQHPFIHKQIKKLLWNLIIIYIYFWLAGYPIQDSMGDDLFHIFCLRLAHLLSTGCPEHRINFFHTHYFLIYFGQVISHFNYYVDMEMSCNKHCINIKLTIVEFTFVTYILDTLF